VRSTRRLAPAAALLHLQEFYCKFLPLWLKKRSGAAGFASYWQLTRQRPAASVTALRPRERIR
jgi:hypothetical protein